MESFACGNSRELTLYFSSQRLLARVFVCVILLMIEILHGFINQNPRNHGGIVYTVYRISSVVEFFELLATVGFEGSGSRVHLTPAAMTAPQRSCRATAKAAQTEHQGSTKPCNWSLGGSIGFLLKRCGVI